MVVKSSVSPSPEHQLQTRRELRRVPLWAMAINRTSLLRVRTSAGVGSGTLLERVGWSLPLPHPLPLSLYPFLFPLPPHSALRQSHVFQDSYKLAM